MRRFTLCLLLTTAALAHAAYLPQDPASSLDALLKDVWAQGADHAYNLYMGKETVRMDPAARKSFPQAMLDLAQNPNVAGIILQKSKMEFHPQAHLPAAEEFDGAYFVHFMRSDFRSNSINERIYINVHPDHAAEVMQFVVQDVLAKPGFPEAKVALPAGLETRADSMLIYAHSLADVDWALGRLSEYQAAHRDNFLPQLPAATHPRLIGISTAAQPEASLKSSSFGEYMARVAQVAMKQTPPPADFAEFRKRVREVMTSDGVDPDHPDRLTHRP